MTGKILFVAFAEPEPIGSNRTAVSQVLELRKRGYPVEMLTSQKDGTWRGPLPGAGSPKLAGLPHLFVERLGISCHVVAIPEIWAERILNEREWEEAVDWGMKALSEIRPAMVHLQQWQYLWWLMESAIRLGIPVVHSVNDYGLACLRTILVTGWDSLCDCRVDVDKCSRCIVTGRNLLGKANELVARLPFGEQLLSAAFGRNAAGPLARLNGIRIPVQKRVSLSIDRCRRVLGNVNALITASPFARSVYTQFGVPADRIHVMPWFYDQKQLCGELREDHETIRLCIVTRISPDKGVHLLLEALQRVRGARRVALRIVGSINSAYALDLQRRFPSRAGSNRVEWCGWIPNDQLPGIYAGVHAVVIPSLCYDNTPLTLVEALAHGRPVICTDVPSMTHLVIHDVNGLVFPMGDALALAKNIERLANQPGLSYKFALNTRNVPSVEEYVDKLAIIYNNIQ